MQYYREVRPQVYNGGGLLNKNFSEERLLIWKLLYGSSFLDQIGQEEKIYSVKIYSSISNWHAYINHTAVLL